MGWKEKLRSFAAALLFPKVQDKDKDHCNDIRLAKTKFAVIRSIRAHATGGGSREGHDSSTFC